MATNFRALQAYGCKNPDFTPPGEVNAGHMLMGSWHADLSKGGAFHLPSRGHPKAKGKAKLRIGPYRKDKIFSPVVLRV